MGHWCQIQIFVMCVPCWVQRPHPFKVHTTHPHAFHPHAHVCTALSWPETSGATDVPSWGVPSWTPINFWDAFFFLPLCCSDYLNHVRGEEHVMIFMCVKGSWPCLSFYVILDKNNPAFNYNDLCHERGQIWEASFSNNAGFFFPREEFNAGLLYIFK